MKVTVLGIAMSFFVVCAQAQTHKHIQAIEATVPAQNSSNPFWLQAAAASVEDKFHTGIEGRFQGRLDPRGIALMGGGQVGFLYGPGTPDTWIIPAQLELTYEASDSKGMTPYLGIATGAAIVHVNSTKADLPTYVIMGQEFGGGSVGFDSSTDVKFTALLRPGLRVGQNFHVELPFGSIGGGNYFSLVLGTKM